MQQAAAAATAQCKDKVHMVLEASRGIMMVSRQLQDFNMHAAGWRVTGADNGTFYLLLQHT
jgi:hypothetical protein